MPRRSRANCAAAGLRVVADTGNEKIGYKVREHSLAKIPVMLVVGRREAEQRSGCAAPARQHGAGSPCAWRSRC